MTTDVLIELYVADVVKQLPRRQRRDVAIELQALLREELADRAEQAGTEPDEAMTLALLTGFGRPAEVAARYRPAPVLIDPGDSRRFITLSVAGLAVIWVLGLASVLSPLPTSATGWLEALREFWFGVGLPALIWPGFLVVCFAGAARARRRWPRLAAWRPHGPERDQINRFGLGAALVFFILGTVALVRPDRLLDLLFGGRAAPAAYEALAYDGAFLRLRGPLVLAVIVLLLVQLAALVVRGRWEPVTRTVDIALTVVMCAVLTWAVVAGPIYVAAPTDQFVKAVLALIILGSLVDLVLKIRRHLRRRAHRLTALV
jgi:hypothetical protein